MSQKRRFFDVFDVLTLVSFAPAVWRKCVGGDRGKWSNRQKRQTARRSTGAGLAPTPCTGVVAYGGGNARDPHPPLSRVPAPDPARTGQASVTPCFSPSHGRRCDGGGHTRGVSRSLAPRSPCGRSACLDSELVMQTSARFSQLPPPAAVAESRPPRLASCLASTWRFVRPRRLQLDNRHRRGYTSGMMNMTDALQKLIEDTGAQIETARASGVNKGLLSRFMRGQRSMTLRTADQIVAALGADVRLVRKRRRKTTTKGR